MSDLKRWKCKRGHVLGQVKQAGHGRHVLYLFREAIDPTADAPAEQDVMAVVEGYVADVRCSVCGALRTWTPGDVQMEKILDRSQEHSVERQTVKVEEGGLP